MGIMDWCKVNMVLVWWLWVIIVVVMGYSDCGE